MMRFVAQISSESPGIYSSTESGLTSRGTAQDTSSTSVSSSESCRSRCKDRYTLARAVRGRDTFDGGAIRRILKIAF